MNHAAALEVLIKPMGAKRYALVAAARNASLAGTMNPVLVTLTIGSDSGMTTGGRSYARKLVTAKGKGGVSWGCPSLHFSTEGAIRRVPG